jgi:hypothetical protein
MIYLIILLVIFLIGGVYSKNNDNFFTDFFDDGLGASIPCILITIILCGVILFGGIIYFVSIGEVAEMEAFQENTLSVYEYTIDKSENITINAIKDAEKNMNTLLNTGNLAYFELAKSVNANLTELRESIRIYNKRLYSYRKYNNNWFTNSFVCNMPEYLKPINMK